MNKHSELLADVGRVEFYADNILSVLDRAAKALMAADAERTELVAALRGLLDAVSLPEGMAMTLDELAKHCATARAILARIDEEGGV